MVQQKRQPGWSRSRARRDADRLLVVLSDIEMGAGGAWDDFPHDPHLAELLLDYAGPEHEDLAIDLVFNGDTFDFLKTDLEGRYPHHVTSEVALAKLERVQAAHALFFSAIEEFCARTGERGRVHFIAGNHDAELLFPAVQERLRALSGRAAPQVNFPGFALDVGRVHVEHGSQFDPLFRMDPAAPFVTHGGADLLNLPWAAVALLDVAIPLQPLLYHHDRLKPKQRVLELIPEIKELLTSAFWDYWTSDYWRDVWRGDDPIKTVSWPMIKELLRRLATWDPDVYLGEDLQRRVQDDPESELYVVGHLHEPAWWSHGRQRLLRTGAMRDEFTLSADGRVQTPINKSYAEVLLAGDEVVRSELVEVPPGERPLGAAPEDIFAVVPKLRELREALAERDRGRPWRALELAVPSRRRPASAGGGALA